MAVAFVGTGVTGGSAFLGTRQAAVCRPRLAAARPAAGDGRRGATLPSTVVPGRRVVATPVAVADGGNPAAAGDASRSLVTPGAGGAAAPEPPATLRHLLKVGALFTLFFSINICFNITNKRLLNLWSVPWTLSTVQLGTGALYCTALWLLGLRRKPNVSKGLIKALLLPSLGHTVGHVCSCISFSFMAISFAHIVKSAEPAFGAVASALFLGEFFPWSVYLSLIPIISGVAMAAVSELTFQWPGFLLAMMANVGFAGRNVFSKLTMGAYKKDPSLTAENLYGLISIISFLMELPFCLIADGIPALGTNPAVPGLFFASSMLYHLYNEVSYLCLYNVSPVTFSVGNTLKRVFIIVASIIAFKTKVLPLNALGMVIAIAGTALYSWTKNRYAKAASAAAAANAEPKQARETVLWGVDQELCASRRCARPR